MNYDKVKQQFLDHDIYSCEYTEPHECNPGWLTIAHRHKRRYYKNREHLLEDFNQTALLCIKAHEMIEFSRKKTEELFQKLRGSDIIK